MTSYPCTNKKKGTLIRNAKKNTPISTTKYHHKSKQWQDSTQKGPEILLPWKILESRIPSKHRHQIAMSFPWIHRILFIILVVEIKNEQTEHKKDWNCDARTPHTTQPYLWQHGATQVQTRNTGTDLGGRRRTRQFLFSFGDYGWVEGFCIFFCFSSCVFFFSLLSDVSLSPN